ncbi:MAG: hypothetical protein L3K09_06605, partial [Thermoplasmata archaeon]|nr:hypothetical protein [Thermoplasmata archaeon]
WDAADGYLVLFGGNGSASAGFLNDTWTFLHGAWTPLSPSVSPERRAAASMTYDAADGYVLLYGGEGNRTLLNLATQTYSGWDYADSWAFSNGSWRNLNVSSPPARDSASITYDASLGKVLLFGGFNWSSYNQADTWEYSAGVWTAVAGSSAVTPWSRNNGALAYDPAIHADVLFGGHAGYYFMNDTQEFANSSWVSAGLGGSPSPRWGSSLAYDPSVGCLVLLGGYDGAPSNNGSAAYLSDTWTYGTNCSVPSTGHGPGPGNHGGNNSSNGSGTPPGHGHNGTRGNPIGGTNPSAAPVSWWSTPVPLSLTEWVLVAAVALVGSGGFLSSYLRWRRRS